MPRNQPSEDRDQRTPQRDRGEFDAEDEKARHDRHGISSKPGPTDEDVTARDQVSRRSHITDETEEADLASSESDDSMHELDDDDLHNMEGPDA